MVEESKTGKEISNQDKNTSTAWSRTRGEEKKNMIILQPKIKK